MKKVFHAVNENLEEVLCAIFLSSVIILMGFQVIGRYIFGYVSPACEETARWAFVWLIYFGAAMGAKRGGHFRVTVYKLIFKGHAGKGITILGDFIWLCFNLFMVFVGLQFVHSVIKQQYLSPTLMVPMKYIYPVIPLGYCLIAVRMIMFSIKNIIHTNKI